MEDPEMTPWTEQENAREVKRRKKPAWLCPSSGASFSTREAFDEHERRYHATNPYFSRKEWSADQKICSKHRYICGSEFQRAGFKMVFDCGHQECWDKAIVFPDALSLVVHLQEVHHGSRKPVGEHILRPNGTWKPRRSSMFLHGKHTRASLSSDITPSESLTNDIGSERHPEDQQNNPIHSPPDNCYDVASVTEDAMAPADRQNISTSSFAQGLQNPAPSHLSARNKASPYQATTEDTPPSDNTPSTSYSQMDDSEIPIVHNGLSTSTTNFTESSPGLGTTAESPGTIAHPHITPHEMDVAGEHESTQLKDKSENGTNKEAPANPWYETDSSQLSGHHRRYHQSGSTSHTVGRSSIVTNDQGVGAEEQLEIIKLTMKYHDGTWTCNQDTSQLLGLHFAFHPSWCLSGQGAHVRGVDELIDHLNDHGHHHPSFSTDTPSMQFLFSWDVLCEQYQLGVIAGCTGVDQPLAPLWSGSKDTSKIDPTPTQDIKQPPKVDALKQPKALRRFNKASEAAYNKLLSVAPSQSAAFRSFTKRLGSHSDLLSRGFRSLETFLKHETATSLPDVYAFLHVAYAVSQIESDEPAKSTPAQFRCGIGTLRGCLSDRIADECEEAITETELFDEIVEVMWTEIDHAVAWIGQRVDWEGMSQNVQRLEIARDMLRKAQKNDALDPDPDIDMGGEPEDYVPSFKREVKEWEEVHGFNVALQAEQDARCYRDPPLDPGIPPGWKRHIARNNPPDKSTWLNVVTGFAFLLVTSFLQTVHQSREALQHELDAPYAFLCHPDPEPPDGTSLPQWEDYRVKSFVGSVKEDIAEPLQALLPSRLTKVAFGLIEHGVIGTIRHFERYILGMRKVLQHSTNQDSLFVFLLLCGCWTCADKLEERFCGTKRIKPALDRTYDSTYLDETYMKHMNVSSLEAEEDAMQLDPTPTLSSNAEVNMHDSSPPDLIPDTSDTSTPSTASPPTVQKGRIRCDVPGCEKKTFYHKANLKRHRDDVHKTSGTGLSYLCGIDSCSRRFLRKDNMYKHQQKKHSVAKKRGGKRPRNRS